MASSLGDKCAVGFSGLLYKTVLLAMMKQDTENFDFNPSTVLQERLNYNTNQLVKNMLWVPWSTLQVTSEAIQRIITLYFLTPSMFWASLFFNVPLFPA